MDYKEAFFKLVDAIVDRVDKYVDGDDSAFEGVTKEIFDVLGKLDDQKSAIEFAAEIAKCYKLEDIDDVLPWAVEFVRKKALESVGIVEKPEESEKAKELESHGAGSEG